MHRVIYRFGEFAIDTGTRQLLAEAAERHLSPKAFELLLTLIEFRSRAISKTELQERLWPSTFVGETNLATLVAEIRRALNDSAQDPAYVRTVHRIGAGGERITRTSGRRRDPRRSGRIDVPRLARDRRDRDAALDRRQASADR